MYKEEYKHKIDPSMFELVSVVQTNDNPCCIENRERV